MWERHAASCVAHLPVYLLAGSAVFEAELSLFGIFAMLTASVRWPNLTQDVTLPQEVISCRTSWPQDWEDITGWLNAVYLMEDKPVELQARLQVALGLPAG